MGCETAIVIGGGNIFRGLSGSEKGTDRVKGDQMGMLATVINSMAIADSLDRAGVDAQVMSAFNIGAFAKPYDSIEAIKLLEAGKVMIFGGGTGSPYFSTDTAAVLRAVEIQADVSLFAKNVDGVYTADPKKDPTAVKYDTISYIDILKHDLKAMDLTAATMAMENDLKILVFGLNDPQNIIRAVKGEKIGTIVERGN